LRSIYLPIPRNPVKRGGEVQLYASGYALFAEAYDLGDWKQQIEGRPLIFLDLLSFFIYIFVLMLIPRTTSLISVAVVAHVAVLYTTGRLIELLIQKMWMEMSRTVHCIIDETTRQQ